jgi:hypothetical protein
MTESNLGKTEIEDAKLPRRDIILLPLIILLTVLVCFLATEVVARHYFAQGAEGNCLVRDAQIGYRFKSHCTMRQKIAESPWIMYQFNECGYRSKEPCGPKPPGTTRIVLLGSSTAEGYLVNYDETFAVRAQRRLGQDYGHPFEIQNLGREECFPICVSKRMDEAMQLRPDLLVLALSPVDIQHLDPAEMQDRDKPMAPLGNPDMAPVKISALKKVQVFLSQSYAVTAIQYFLYQNASTFIRLYLHGGDSTAYIRTPLSPAWMKRFDAFDLLLGEMTQRARTAQVPLVVMEMPSLAQGSLLSMDKQPQGVDAGVFDAELKRIAASHGVQFIDVLDAFQHGPKANRLFYVINGHVNGAGSALASDALVEQLEQQQSPTLAGHSQTQDALERGR